MLTAFHCARGVAWYTRERVVPNPASKGGTMAIDPRLYEKYSGRSGDPYKRLGEALAKNVKHKHSRDEMPKGVSGGFRTIALPGFFAQILNWFKNRSRSR